MVSNYLGSYTGGNSYDSLLGSSIEARMSKGCGRWMYLSSKNAVKPYKYQRYQV